MYFYIIAISCVRNKVLLTYYLLDLFAGLPFCLSANLCLCYTASSSQPYALKIDSGHVRKYQTQFQYLNNIKVKCSQFGWQVPDVFEHVLHR